MHLVMWIIFTKVWKELKGMRMLNSPLLRLGVGACAGIIAMSATYPMDLVQGRLTVQGVHLLCYFAVRQLSMLLYIGITQALATVLREEGPCALYKGWLPSVIGVVSTILSSFGFAKKDLMHYTKGGFLLSLELLWIILNKAQTSCSRIVVVQLKYQPHLPFVQHLWWLVAIFVLQYLCHPCVLKHLILGTSLHPAKLSISITCDRGFSYFGKPKSDKWKKQPTSRTIAFHFLGSRK